MSERKRINLSTRAFRAAVSNDRSILPGVDERSRWARRFRDLIIEHETDLGGREVLSAGQRALVRRAALLQTQSEQMEARFAETEEVGYKPMDLYQRVTNTLRRTLESLNLHRGRKPRDVTTLGQVLRG